MRNPKDRCLCGALKSRKAISCDPCYRVRAAAHLTFTCMHCGKVGRPNSQGTVRKFCTRACAFAYQKANAKPLIVRACKCGVPLRKGRVYCSLGCRPLIPGTYAPVITKSCSVCGSSFVGRKARTTCGHVCLAVAERERERRYRQSPAFRAKKKAYHQSPAFKALRKRYRPVAKLMRKARERGVEYEAVNPAKVFARDKWRCLLCHKRTPKRLRGQMHPDAPELDHIVPLSLGGAHSYANTQCACRSCNGAKHATVRGQLRLV